MQVLLRVYVKEPNGKPLIEAASILELAQSKDLLGSFENFYFDVVADPRVSFRPQAIMACIFDHLDQNFSLQSQYYPALDDGRQ